MRTPVASLRTAKASTPEVTNEGHGYRSPPSPRSWTPYPTHLTTPARAQQLKATSTSRILFRLPLPDPSLAGWAAWNHARFGGGVEGGHNHASGRSDLSANLHYKLVSSQNDLSVPSTAYLLNFDWKNWGREYGFSYLHRLVVRRQVRNPFEEDHVKGIQNYVDLGIDVNLRKPSTNSNSSSSNATAAAPAPGSNARVGGDGDGGGAPSLVDIALAMSWQINKNLLLKSRVDDTDISFVAAGILTYFCAFAHCFCCKPGEKRQEQH